MKSLQDFSYFVDRVSRYNSC